MEMRILRNQLAHEYPDRPDITASILNQVNQSIPELLTCLDDILKKIDF